MAPPRAWQFELVSADRPREGKTDFYRTAPSGRHSVLVPSQRRVAFSRYVAALDREEVAAGDYRRATELVHET